MGQCPYGDDGRPPETCYVGLDIYLKKAGGDDEQGDDEVFVMHLKRTKISPFKRYLQLLNQKRVHPYWVVTKITSVKKGKENYYIPHFEAVKKLSVREIKGEDGTEALARKTKAYIDQMRNTITSYFSSYEEVMGDEYYNRDHQLPQPQFPQASERVADERKVKRGVGVREVDEWEDEGEFEIDEIPEEVEKKTLSSPQKRRGKGKEKEEEDIDIFLDEEE